MSEKSVLTDEIIGDIIPLKISADMSVSTLDAIGTIFYLRLQLAQVGWDDDTPIYEDLCINRFGQIADALTDKYPTATAYHPDERIAILNLLENISVTLNQGHCDFAIEKRQELLDSPNLTFTQKYRLDNLLEFNYDNIREDIDRLLAEAKTAFDMAILFEIESLGTRSQYAAIMDLYESMFKKAIAEGNVHELSNLLAIAAYSNSSPTRRKKIKALTSKLYQGIQSRGSEFSELAVPSAVPSLPVLLVNPIAAEIYSRIDKITGKYDILTA